jgi:hypothetical protein
VTGVEDLDEVVVDAEVDGEEVRRTIGRKTWQRGGWATIAIGVEVRSGADWVKKVMVLRMQKTRGLWRKHAAVTMTEEEARGLAEAIGTWLG